MKPIPWNEVLGNNKRSALFLDRDGTLIKWQEGYRSDPDKIVFISDAFICLERIIFDYDFCFLVTNQSGIQKGLVTEAQVDAVNQKVVKYIQEQTDAKVHKVYVCPHLPDTCECRKPKPGMFLQAIQEFNLEPAQCLMIGDAESDIIAANLAGIPGILVNRH